MQHKFQAPVNENSLVDRINVLRGLAIAGVIAIHTSAHFPEARQLSPVVYANIVVDVFAHYAVPLFVLLSGVTLSRRYGRDATPLSMRAFFTRRLSKVIPPYVVFSLLYLLLFAVQYQPPAPSWIVIALATGNAYYHLWFVALLVQLYLLFPLLRTLLARAGKRWAGVILLVALLLQVSWNLGSPLLATGRPLLDTLLSDRVFLSHLFYFVLGMVAGLYLEGFDRRVRRLPAWPLLVVVVVLVGLTSAQWIEAIRRFGSLDTVPAGVLTLSVAAESILFLAIIVLAWQLAVRLERGSPDVKNALAWLGVLSLPIYLVHPFFQWLLARAFAPLGLTPAGWAFYPAMFAGTLLLSYGAAVLFTRLPYGEYLTGAPRPQPAPYSVQQRQASE